MDQSTLPTTSEPPQKNSNSAKPDSHHTSSAQADTDARAAKDLKDLNKAADRVCKANLPPAPYLVSVDGAARYNNELITKQWTAGTPFAPDEGHLQYQSLLYRDTSSTLLRLESPFDNYGSHNHDGTKNVPSGTSPASPLGANTPLQAAAAGKKKISLSDYKSRQQGLSRAGTPATDLRKETLKKGMNMDSRPVTPENPSQLPNFVPNNAAKEPQKTSAPAATAYFSEKTGEGSSEAHVPGSKSPKRSAPSDFNDQNESSAKKARHESSDQLQVKSDHVQKENQDDNTAVLEVAGGEAKHASDVPARSPKRPAQDENPEDSTHPAKKLRSDSNDKVQDDKIQTSEQVVPSVSQPAKPEDEAQESSKTEVSNTTSSASSRPDTIDQSTNSRTSELSSAASVIKSDLIAKDETHNVGSHDSTDMAAAGEKQAGDESNNSDGSEIQNKNMAGEKTEAVNDAAPPTVKISSPPKGDKGSPADESAKTETSHRRDMLLRLFKTTGEGLALSDIKQPTSWMPTTAEDAEILEAHLKTGTTVWVPHHATEDDAHLGANGTSNGHQKDTKQVPVTSKSGKTSSAVRSGEPSSKQAKLTPTTGKETQSVKTKTTDLKAPPATKTVNVPKNEVWYKNGTIVATKTVKPVPTSTFFKNLEQSGKATHSRTQSGTTAKPSNQKYVTKLSYGKSNAKTVERMLRLPSKPLKSAGAQSSGQLQTAANTSTQQNHNKAQSTDLRKDFGAKGVPKAHEGAIPRKRPAADDGNLNKSPEKKQKTTDTTDSKPPQTPQKTRLLSPVSLTPAKATQNSPKPSSGHLKSSSQQAATPTGNAISPQALGSAGKQAIESRSSNDGKESSSQSSKAEYNRIWELAKKLRTSMRTALEQESKEVGDAAKLKTAAVEGVESVLCFMKAFSVQQRYETNKDTLVKAWESILPWTAEVVQACDGYDHLYGMMQFLRSACCAELGMAFTRVNPETTKALINPTGGPESGRPTALKRVLDSISNMQRYAGISNQHLPRSIQAEKYPQTYEESLLLPAGMAMDPRAAIKVGYKFLNEWTKQEKLSWTQQVEA